MDRLVLILLLTLLPCGVYTTCASRVCPTDFLLYGGKCYQYVDEGQDWTQAVDHCQSLGGYLAEPKSSSEYQHIKTLIKDNGVPNDVYIGGKLIDSEWTWVRTNDVIDYLPWSSPNPSGNGECLSLWGERDYGLDDIECDDSSAQSVCQAAPAMELTTTAVPTEEATTESSWTLNDDNGVYYKVFDEKLSFHNALALCESHNATLVSPRNRAENRFLKNLTLNSVWLGITDTLKEGTWRFLNGELVSWTNWHTGQRRNGDFVLTKALQQTWGQRGPRAHRRRVNVCQLGTSRSSGEAPIPSTYFSDWAINSANGLYYKEFPDKRNYYSALSLCESHNATLVSPRNQGENQFLQQLTRNPVWLGITDTLKRGTWRYISGDLVTWTNWTPGNPDGGRFGHTRATTQTWSDRGKKPGNEVKATVCQTTDKTTIRYFGPNGTFYSPDHPSNYRNNERCGQTFEVGEGQLVELNFVEFRIKASPNCSFDNVTIFDGPNNKSDILGTYCGLTEPGPVRSTGRQLYLYFQTDDSGTMYRGYRGTWRAISDGQIPLWHMALRTEICSLGRFNKLLFDFPGNLGNGLPMTYGQTFVVGEGQVVELSVHESQVEEGSDCSSDIVTFYDGPNRKSTLLGTYYLSELPDKVMSTGRQLYVYMQTNGAVTRRGFSGSYRSISDVCGSFHRGAYGTFTSPDYPTGYPNNIRCGQTIEVGRGQVVELTFEDFDLQLSSPSCFNDKLIIYDGPDRNSPPIGTYCGHTVPGPLNSTGHQLYLHFQSDGAGGGRGFKGTYRAEYSFSCGTTLRQSLGLWIPHTKRTVHDSHGDDNIENHPWLVLIDVNFNDFFRKNIICGGAIISRNWVITAAKCFESPWHIKVYVGSTERKGRRSQIFSVKRVIRHPDFEFSDWHVFHDIALIEIDGEFDVMSATTRPVCLPRADDYTTFDDQRCVVTGWGDGGVRGWSYASNLQNATYKVLSNRTCERMAWYHGQYSFRKDIQLCAGKFKGVCQGDSGAPLVCDRPDGTKVLAGILSFHYTESCRSEYTAVYRYTRLSYYRQWIDETIYGLDK